MVHWMMPRITDDELAAAVANCSTISDVVRRLGRNPAGGNHSHISRRIKLAGLDTSHFLGQGWNRGRKQNAWRRTASDILIRRPQGSSREHAYLLERALIESGISHACVECGNEGEWQGKPLKLQIHHIDGDWLNNLIENLRFLCPNCHDQVPTKRRE